MDITVEKAIYYGYSPGNFYVDSRQGPENYAFVHFLRPMMIRVDDQVIPVKTGAFILFTHGNRQQYYPQTVDMLEHWFRFLGDGIPEWLQELDFPMNRPFYIRDPGPADRMLKMIASAYDTENQLAAGMGVQALLYYLASALKVAEPGNESIQKLHDLRMIIRERLDSHLTVAELAEMVNYSPSHFQNLYRQEFGVSPMQDISRMRIERARYLLTFTSYSVERIAQALCYSSVTSFITKFRRETGVSPLRYRKQTMYSQNVQQEV